MGVYRKGFKPMFQSGLWKVVRGDTVMIMAGKDKGSIGTVTEVIRDVRRPLVVVEGCNLTRRHIKETPEHPAGSVMVEAPLHYSNVSLLDPSTRQPVRVEWRYLEDGSRVRETRGRRATRSVLAMPAPPTRTRRVAKGDADTPKDHVSEVTHTKGDLPSALGAIDFSKAPRNVADKGWRSFAASAFAKN